MIIYKFNKAFFGVTLGASKEVTRAVRVLFRKREIAALRHNKVSIRTRWGRGVNGKRLWFVWIKAIDVKVSA